MNTELNTTQKNYSDIQSDLSMLEEVNSFQKLESENDNDYDFLKKDLHLYRKLETGIWYHLISPLSYEQKVHEIFELMKSSIAKRCMDLGKTLK